MYGLLTFFPLSNIIVLMADTCLILHISFTTKSNELFQLLNSFHAFSMLIRMLTTEGKR